MTQKEQVHGNFLQQIPETGEVSTISTEKPLKRSEKGKFEKFNRISTFLIFYIK